MRKISEAEAGHYMIFENLKTMKRNIDAILAMDQEHVKHLLRERHDWAADHVSSAKDDIDEVADFLINQTESSNK